MDDLFLLSERQMARISPFFPLAHGVPRVDDRRVVSGIVYERMEQDRTSPVLVHPPELARQALGQLSSSSI